MAANPTKTVVITGATAGVGLAVARAFAGQGARIGLIARGQERLETTAAEVASLGGDALILPTDVGDAAQVSQAAEAVEDQFGPIDIWINNAVATVFSPLSAMTPDEFKRITDVSYLGYVYGTMAALARMRERDQGTIVQVSSAVAFRGVPLQSAYSGAKHAVMGFTHALRSELIHEQSRVHVTLVHLPAVNTEHYQWAGNRMGIQPRPMAPAISPEEAAGAIAWAAEARQREVWVGGQTMQALVANWLAPEALDYYLAWRCYQGDPCDAAEGPGNLWQPSPADLASPQALAALGPWLQSFANARLGSGAFSLGQPGAELARLLFKHFGKEA